MIPVLKGACVRAFDAGMIEAGVPSLVLMENAGARAAEIVDTLYLPQGRTAHVLIVCGVGNNGGDGFVVARHLATRHRAVCIMHGGREHLTPDAAANLRAFEAVGGTVLFPAASATGIPVGEWDLVVDALFGTGLSRPLEGAMRAVVEAINMHSAPVVALDIPSGLCADRGIPLGVVVKAKATVTFAFHKRGLWTPQGQMAAGCIHLASIGVPAGNYAPEGTAQIYEAEDIARLVARRGATSHKYRAGHVAVVGGADGKVGAAYLAAHAALRAGAGLVTLASPSSHASQMACRTPELMTAAIDANDVRSSLAGLYIKKRALVVGPGLGLDALGTAVINDVLEYYKGPWVADADALTLLASQKERLHGAEAVLAPHSGELARLLDTTAEHVENDRFALALEAAEYTQCVIVLKGSCTVVAAPNGRLAINRSGSALLATAGSGDTLSGILGALLCSLPPFEAAVVGTFLHGATADRIAMRLGGAERGVLAHEFADELPATLAELLNVARTSALCQD